MIKNVQVDQIKKISVSNSQLLLQFFSIFCYHFCNSCVIQIICIKITLCLNLFKKIKISKLIGSME